jgi:hypothetical protein
MKMKMKRLYYILTILILANTFSFAQDTISIPQYEQSEQLQSDWETEMEHEVIDDFAPGLFIFIVFAFIFILIYVGAGIVLTILGLLILFGLILAGILSASILVGLNKKSFKKGFKTFLVSITTIGGLIIGIIGFWMLNEIYHWWNIQTTLLIGSISGLLSGLVFGFFSYYVIQKFTTLLNSKLNNN